MSKNIFRFAFITDTKIGMNSPSGLHKSGSDKERLERAITYVNENEVDFVIFGGDQINNANDEHTEAQLDVLEACLSALTVPYYGVIGNHETDEQGQGWKYIKRGLPVRFSFSYQHAFFIGVNAPFLREDKDNPYAQEEWKFLKTQFSQVPPECEHRFVVMHWPLFNAHPGEEDTYWNMPNRTELINFFTQHKVSCILSGHWHQDIDARWKDISLITSIGTSRPLQYPEERSIKIVTVFQGGWSVRRVSVEHG